MGYHSKTHIYDCQHGKQYFKRTTKHLCIQGTNHSTHHCLYPKYKITETEWKELKVHELRQLKNRISEALKGGEHACKIERRYIVSLPTNEAYEKFHPTGIVGGILVHPMMKIEELKRELQTSMK